MPTTHKRVVLKVWERNGVVCDNASEIDFLETNGWTVQCTEPLSSDGPGGEGSVLYVMNPPPSLTLTNNPPPPPASHTVLVAAPPGSTIAMISCSMTRGRMLFRPLDELAATVFEIDPSPTASFPFLSAGIVPPVDLNKTPPPAKKYMMLVCINDSAPPDRDATVSEAPNAVVSVEVSFPGDSLGTATNPVTAVPSGTGATAVPNTVPSGMTQVYYLIISTTT